jgi:hypothetical protein
VQGNQTAERHRLSIRDVSGRELRPVRGADANLSGRGMLAQQSLRIRLRLPRYWRRHETLPGAGNLFRCRRLHGGQLWIRLHLRQSRGAQVRLRFGGGVSHVDLYVEHRLRIRLRLRRGWQRRPVCLKSASLVTAPARTRIPRTPGRVPGVRLFAGKEDISQSSAFPAHAITQQGNRAGRETLRKGCRAAAPSRPRGRCYRAVAASRSMVGPRVPLPSPRAGRGQRHLLLDHFVVAAAERRDALPRLRTTSAVAEATYLSRRLVARLSKG